DRNGSDRYTQTRETASLHSLTLPQVRKRGRFVAANASTNCPMRKGCRPGCRPGQPSGDTELFRLEAVGCELVAVEVADIGRIGTGKPTARPGRTFVLAAGCQSGLVEFSNRRTARRDEADRAAIGEARRLSVG